MLNNIVNKNPLTNVSIDLDTIKDQLETITNELSSLNKQNLTDANIICEEIFGELLNLLLDIKLRSASGDLGDSRYPSVDLVDFENRIAFQISSVCKKNQYQKILNTVKKFNNGNKRLYERIDSLNILFISPMQEFRNTNDLPLGNKSKFVFKENIYDINRLIELIHKKGKGQPEIYSKVYDIINTVFDSGRLRYRSILMDAKRNSKLYVTKLPDQIVWTNGFFGCELTAILSKYGDISAKLTFTKRTLDDFVITFDKQTLIDRYFVDKKIFSDLHFHGHFANDHEFFFKFENIQVTIDFHVAEQVRLLFDMLKKQYLSYIKI